MASSNMGKKFEQNFSASCKDDSLFVYRIKDTDLSFNGNSVSSFTTQNICDFFIFGGVENGKGNLFAIECKSTCYNSISIETNPEEKNTSKMIKPHQLQKLNEVSLNDGIYAGFVLNFRDDTDNSKEVTYYMSIEAMNQFLEETHKKSINKVDCSLRGIKIEQTLKRKYYKYNI